MHTTEVKHKYKAGDKVYVMTKNGVEYVEVRSVLVEVNSNKCIVQYYLSTSVGIWDRYDEDQIIDNNRKSVSKRLKEIEQQLPLLLE